MSNIKEISRVFTEPVSLEEAKKHLGIEGFDGDDEMVKILIQAAREMVEEHTGHTLAIEAVSEAWFSEFAHLPNKMHIRKFPFIDVVKVEYYDTDNNLQTLATSEYDIDPLHFDITICEYRRTYFPATYEKSKAVKVTVKSGYTQISKIPKPLIQAMKLIIGHLYENRQEVVIGKIATEIPFASETLMRPYRIPV